MEVVADLVDGALLGLGEVAGGVKGVWRKGLVFVVVCVACVCILAFFKEKADLVPRRQEIVVADVVAAVLAAGAELGHGVRGEVEVGQQGVRLVQQGLDGGGAEGVGDDEVAVAVEGGELGGGQAACGVRGFGHVGRGEDSRAGSERERGGGVC